MAKIDNAAENIGTPLISHFEARPTPQRSADYYIGGSVNDLVALASKISAETPREPSSETVTATEKLVGSQIKIVIQDIETAAAAARNRVREIERSPSEKAIATSMQYDGEAGDTPIAIEIYKKPRVEVYRRRPSGQFERD